MTWQSLRTPRVIYDNWGHMRHMVDLYKDMHLGRVVEDVPPTMYQMPLRR